MYCYPVSSPPPSINSSKLSHVGISFSLTSSSLCTHLILTHRAQSPFPLPPKRNLAGYASYPPRRQCPTQPKRIKQIWNNKPRTAEAACGRHARKWGAGQEKEMRGKTKIPHRVSKPSYARNAFAVLCTGWIFFGEPTRPKKKKKEKSSRDCCHGIVLPLYSSLCCKLGEKDTQSSDQGQK